MSKPFVPRPYQEPVINFITNTPRCGVWADMGMGKTVSVLSAIVNLIVMGTLRRPVLILAPLRVAVNTWPKEALKWNHTKALKVACIAAGKDAGERAQILRTIVNPETRSHVYVLNYENIAWLMQELKKMRVGFPFDMVVADESTKLKNFRTRSGGKRARLLGACAFRPGTKRKFRKSETEIRWVNLTGTPSPNGLKDLWGQTWFLDKGKRLGKSFSAFIARWFRKLPHLRFGDGVPIAGAAEEIEEILSDIHIVVRAKDHFDLREPIDVNVEVELPPKARRLYDQMERDFYLELGDDAIEAVNAAVKNGKCMQIANGALYVGEDGEHTDVHNAKLEALRSIIEEAAGSPILVAYKFKSDLKRLQAEFKSGRVLDKNPKTLDDWNAGKIPLLFAHPASAGHGLDLQDGGHRLVFFSMDWNWEEHAQIKERLGPTRQIQSGYDRPVYYYYIIAKKTVDADALRVLQGKASVDEALRDGIKSRQAC